MITVNWEHIVLDERVFERFNTHRVARARNRAYGLGEGDPFPVRLHSNPDDPPTYRSRWSPRLDRDGWAPDNYTLPGDPRIYDFHFWSVVATAGITFNDVYPRSNPHGTEIDPGPSFGIVNVTLHATAWYGWNRVGSGIGDSSAAYIDAFSIDAGDFIPDDFAVVEPDDFKGTQTLSANNGIVNTVGIDPETVRARNPTGDYPSIRYDFDHWRPIWGANVADVPPPPGAGISLGAGHNLEAYAYYNHAIAERFVDITQVLEVGHWERFGDLVVFVAGPPVGPIKPDPMAKRLGVNTVQPNG